MTNAEINNSTITDCDLRISSKVNVAGYISGSGFTGNTTDVIKLVS